MSNDSVKISLEVATQAAEIAIARFKTKTGEASNAFSVFQGTLGGGLALAGLNALSSALSGSFSAAIAESREASKAILDLNLALQNSGNYSEKTSEEFVAFADSIEQSTIYSQDAVIANLALLESMTGLEKDGLMRAQKAAVELAATFNLDLNTATEMIAKAHNGQTMALSKLGIKFNETGSDARNYEQILSDIEKRNGNAEAKSKSFDGQLLVLGNSVDNLLQSFGDFISKNSLIADGLGLLIGLINKTASGIQALGEFARDNEILFGSLSVAIGIVSIGLIAVATKAAIASGAFTFLAGTATAAWAAITAPITLTIAAIAAVGAAVYGLYKYFNKAEEDSNKANKAMQDGSNQTKDTLNKNNKEVTDALAEENKKRIKEIDDFTAKLSKQSQDMKFQGDIRLRDLQTYNETKDLMEKNALDNNINGKLARENNYFSLKKELMKKELDEELNKINQSTQNETMKNQAKLALTQKFNSDVYKANFDHLKAVTALEDMAQQEKMNKIIAQNEFEKTQNELKLENLAMYNEALNLVDEEQDNVSYTAKLEREQAYYDMKNANLDAQYQNDLLRIQNSKMSEEEKNRALISAESKYNTDSSKLSLELAKKKVDIKKSQKEAEDKINTQTIQATSDLFGVLAQVAETGGEEMWAITKTFQIAQAITSGILAVQNALTLPFPANLIAAASMGITTALNVSKIMNTQPKKYAVGGIVAGNQTVGDKVPILANAKEAIVTTTQQSNFLRAANGTTFGNDLTNEILLQILKAVQNNQSIYIGEKELFTVIRDGLNSGRTFA